MSEKQPILHLLCGKIAAGKSTLAARLAADEDNVLISEDFWLSRLYPGEIKTLEDYVRYSGCLRAVMGPHVQTLLRSGLSVVLDFPANTLQQRAWLRSLFEASGSAHRLHFLDVTDTVCKARLRQRNREETHDFAPDEKAFDLVTGYFVPPRPEEGFNIIRHDAG